VINILGDSYHLRETEELFNQQKSQIFIIGVLK